MKRTLYYVAAATLLGALVWVSIKSWGLIP